MSINRYCKLLNRLFNAAQKLRPSKAALIAILWSHWVELQEKEGRLT